jgi:hypothetical protein
MSKRALIEAELDKAREALKLLQDELPQFHALLTDNEAAVQRLKAERASLDAQAQARGRTEIARELLEQHQADIQGAKAEVDRLEPIFERENALQMLEQHATDAARHKNAFDDRLASANRTLEAGVQKLLGAYDDLTASRQAFATVAGDDKVLISELAERGVSLTQSPTPYQAYPAPYGPVIGELVMSIIGERAMAAERARWAAQRTQRREAVPPRLKGLAVDPGDADRAAERLGDLVQEVTHRQRGNVGQKSDVVFSVRPGDLERAEVLLKGIRFVYESNQPAHVR